MSGWRRGAGARRLQLHGEAPLRVVDARPPGGGGLGGGGLGIVAVLGGGGGGGVLGWGAPLGLGLLRCGGWGRSLGRVVEQVEHGVGRVPPEAVVPRRERRARDEALHPPLGRRHLAQGRCRGSYARRRVVGAAGPASTPAGWPHREVAGERVVDVEAVAHVLERERLRCVAHRRRTAAHSLIDHLRRAWRGIGRRREGQEA